MRSDHQWRNLRRRNAMSGAIKDAAKGGFKLVWLTPFQVRVNGVLDLYPTNWKFHNLKTGERGYFEDAYDCMVSHAKEKP